MTIYPLCSEIIVFDSCVELKQGMQMVLLVSLDTKVDLVNGS